MSRNLVPTLLGDILQQLYARTARKWGTPWCCDPLLVRWFILHLPKLVLRNEEGRGWAHRLMSLTDNDITWTLRGLDEVAIIDRCGEYPNVPLIGTHFIFLLLQWMVTLSLWKVVYCRDFCYSIEW